MGIFSTTVNEENDEVEGIEKYEYDGECHGGIEGLL